MISFFRRYSKARFEAAVAICNRLARGEAITSVEVRHAQIIDRKGNLRVYTDDGGEYILSIRKVK